MTEFSIEKDNTLFVFGPARGGTTYLTTFLDDWFDYGMGPEGTFIKQFYKRLPHYGDLSEESNFIQLVTDVSKSEMMEIMRNVWLDDEKIDVTAESIMKYVQERSYHGVVFAVFAAVADLRGKKRLGSKDPSFWRYWRVLDELFGDRANYLCIVRDGRDVALSLFRESWGEKSVYIAARRWVQFLDTVEEMREQIPVERLSVIRYETLLTEPENSVTELERITGVCLSDNMKRDTIDAISNNKYANNFNKWKKVMSERDIGIFEAVASHWLEAYDYELSGKQVNIGFHEKAFYELEEIWRKVALTAGDIIVR